VQASDPESCRCVALCTTRGLISVDESDWPGSIKAAQQWASGGGRVLDAAAAGSGTGTSTPHFLLLWGAGLLVRAPLPSGTDSGGLTGQSSIEIKRNTWRCPQEKPGYYPPPPPPPPPPPQICLPGSSAPHYHKNTTNRHFHSLPLSPPRSTTTKERHSGGEAGFTKLTKSLNLLH